MINLLELGVTGGLLSCDEDWFKFPPLVNNSLVNVQIRFEEYKQMGIYGFFALKGDTDAAVSPFVSAISELGDYSEIAFHFDPNYIYFIKVAQLYASR